jgi:hypothetical protein
MVFHAMVMLQHCTVCLVVPLQQNVHPAARASL